MVLYFCLPIELAPVPEAFWPAVTAILLLAAVASFIVADRLLPAPQTRAIRMLLVMAIGTLCLVASVLVEILAHRQGRLLPPESAYGAILYMASALNSSSPSPL